MSTATSTGAKQRLMAEMKTLRKEKWIHFEDGDDDNLLMWRFALMVINSESVFNGGYFRAEMTFTDEYPYSPPKFRFLVPITHPNIYPDGQLCISILHKPGDDDMSGEAASERWSPLQGAESVLRSVLLLLDAPEIASPANVDAGVLYRDQRATYATKARDTVARSLKDVPSGFEMPTSFEAAPPVKLDDDDDENFWVGSSDNDEEFDFGGGSDSEESGDQEMGEEEDEEEGDDDEDEEESGEEGDEDEEIDGKEEEQGKVTRPH